MKKSKDKKLTPKEQLAFAKKSREKTKSFLLTEKILREVKNNGRP